MICLLWIFSAFVINVCVFLFCFFTFYNQISSSSSWKTKNDKWLKTNSRWYFLYVQISLTKSDPIKIHTVIKQRRTNCEGLQPVWPLVLVLSLSLPLRVLMTGWRSCVRSRRVGPSPTKSSETSSVRLRRKWCLMLTGRSCRGESTIRETHKEL